MPLLQQKPQLVLKQGPDPAQVQSLAPPPLLQPAQDRDLAQASLALAPGLALPPIHKPPPLQPPVPTLAPTLAPQAQTTPLSTLQPEERVATLPSSRPYHPALAPALA